MQELVTAALLLIATVWPWWSMSYIILPSDPAVYPNSAGYTYCDGTIYVNYRFFEDYRDIYGDDLTILRLASLLIHESAHHVTGCNNESEPTLLQLIFAETARFPQWMINYSRRLADYVINRENWSGMRRRLWIE